MQNNMNIFHFKFWFVIQRINVSPDFFLQGTFKHSTIYIYQYMSSFKPILNKTLNLSSFVRTYVCYTSLIQSHLGAYERNEIYNRLKMIQTHSYWPFISYCIESTWYINYFLSVLIGSLKELFFSECPGLGTRYRLFQKFAHHN